MGIRYLWDTNTVIYYLQKQFSPQAEKFIDELLVNDKPLISVISEIELLCWNTTAEEDIELLHGFINDIEVVELEQQIKLKTAYIRKKYKLKLPDAIIASTAIVYGFTLITRNVTDFNNIEGLKIIDLFSL